jgi:hypothetical protein
LFPGVNNTAKKLFTGVNNTVDKFFAGVVNASNKTVCKYLREFVKKFEMVLMGYSGVWGKLINEKKHKAENLGSDSL